MSRLTAALQRLPDFVQFWAVSTLACLLFLPFLSWVVFSGDDSHLMRVALDYGGLQPYLQPQVYRELSVANYTPIPMTVYRWITLAFPFRPLFFLMFMIGCMSLVVALVASLVSRVTQDRRAGWLAILLVVSSLSIPTLLSRFYTMHYLIGAVFALLALHTVLPQPRGTIQRATRVLLASLLMFMALLAKEVYLMLVPVVLLLAWQRRDWSLAVATIVVASFYWLWRGYMLGMQMDVGSESSYFAGFWNVSPSAWLAFAGFYFTSRWLILLAVLAALLVDGRQTLKLLGLALLFGLPGLAVTHGIAEYALHSDRIFFALDVALAMVAAIVVSQDERVRRLGQPETVAAMLTLVFFIQVLAVRDYRREAIAAPDYRITRYLLDRFNAVADQTALVPMNFIQGDLMRVSQSLKLDWVTLTQNCLQALEVPASQLLAFDDRGELLPRETVQAQCQPAADLAVVEHQLPQYQNGLLSWQLQAPSGVETGVLFTDRAFAVPLPAFNSQLVKPKPGERYQIFARQENRWWFSEIREIAIH